jgi:hypothetical protein
MATHANTAAPSARGRGYMADQRFFTRFAIFLAIFILFGFIQFQLRGFVNVRTAPAFLHLHGALMVSWLGMFVLQSVLISRMQVQLHRTLGWLTVGIATAVVVVGSYTGIHAVALGIVPPFFSPAFFLAVNQLGIAAFALTVVLAVVFRCQVQWHRRLIIGSGIIIAVRRRAGDPRRAAADGRGDRAPRPQDARPGPPGDSGGRGHRGRSPSLGGDRFAPAGDRSACRKHCGGLSSRISPPQRPHGCA